MKDFTRRTALAVSAISAAGLPILFPSSAAAARRYAANEGKEIRPGVRIVRLTERASNIPEYKTISMRDMVFQPNSEIVSPRMRNDMVCHMLEGTLFIDNGGGDQFVAATGQIWSCAKGQPETAVNQTDAVAIMRIIDLIEG